MQGTDRHIHTHNCQGQTYALVWGGCSWWSFGACTTGEGMSSSSSSSSITLLRLTGTGGETDGGDDACDDACDGTLFTKGDPPSEREPAAAEAAAAAVVDGASPFTAGALVKNEVIFFIQGVQLPSVCFGAIHQ